MDDAKIEGLTNSHRAILMDVYGAWIKHSLKLEDRGERANKRMLSAMFPDIDIEGLADLAPESLSDVELAEHAIFSGYVALAGMQLSIRQCEYYFRRYPFHGLPISRTDYLRNTCEMLFDRIIQFRDRLKNLMNAIKKFVPDLTVGVGDMIKSFGNIQKLRNLAHHNQRFDDDAISQLSIIELFESARDYKLGSEQSVAAATAYTQVLSSRSLYRQACAKWITHVKDFEQRSERYLELVAQIVLLECKFLAPYISKETTEKIEELPKLGSELINRIPKTVSF